MNKGNTYVKNSPVLINASSILYEGGGKTLDKLFDLVYPVGSIYLSTSATNPSTLFSGTTWVQVSKGRFLLGCGMADANNYGGFGDLNNNGYDFGVEGMGGQYNHYLTTNEMPSHGHSIGWPSGTADVRINSNSIAGSASVTIGGLGGTTYPTPGANATGGSQWHNNMPPYYCVYIWKRTA